MINEVFGFKVSRNIEVYVDDIILKSKKVEILPQDMREHLSKYTRSA